MAASKQWPEIEDLWLEEHPNKLFYCVCEKDFASTTVVRTFRLARPGLDNPPIGHSKILHSPLEHDIVLFDRHLDCLRKSDIRYATISHVWDPTISKTNLLGIKEPHLINDLEHTRQSAVKEPYTIYQGLLRSGQISDTDEIWHDYISVPQWNEDIKSHILLTVPHIYGSSYVTAVILHDLKQESINLLLHGKSTDERLKGITDTCNSSWFSRVWTAMEFVRSHRLIAVNEKYDVCSTNEDPVFLDWLEAVWNEELANHESVQQLEARAKIGENLVPWNLGLGQFPPGGIKALTFGHAFGILSRRKCLSDFDFLNALLGCACPMSDRPLKYGSGHEYSRIAKLCLSVGDFSPLLMTPEGHDLGHEFARISGFQNVVTWPLGMTIKPLAEPDHRHPAINFPDGDGEHSNPIIKMQVIGTISNTHRRFHDKDRMTNFADEVSIVLQATGPKTKALIETLGGRLYGESSKFYRTKAQGRR